MSVSIVSEHVRGLQYNEDRQHDALGGLPPVIYAERNLGTLLLSCLLDGEAYVYSTYPHRSQARARARRYLLRSTRSRHIRNAGVRAQFLANIRNNCDLTLVIMTPFLDTGFLCSRVIPDSVPSGLLDYPWSRTS